MATFTVEQALQTGVAHHQAGRLGDAEAIYRQILAVQPQHADALHLLGLIATSRGHYQDALDLMSPKAAIYRPNLGELYSCVGRLDDAISCFRKALAFRADFPECHVNLAKALAFTGRLDEAIESFHLAIAQRPDFAVAYNNLGGAHSAKGNRPEAIDCFRRAVAWKPAYAEAKFNLGNALSENGQLEEGILFLRHSLASKPDNAEGYLSLGYALSKLDQWEEAERCFRRAHDLDPNNVELVHNLGNALLHLGRFSDALVCCRRTLELKPELPEAHVNHGCALMYFRRYREGWRGLEWRLRCLAPSAYPSHFTADQWDGTSMCGKTILLYAEQGLGDTIQFLRFVPLVRDRMGATRIILECPPALFRLVDETPGWNAEVFARQESDRLALPSLRRNVSLSSLPYALGEFDPLPMSGPYLRADSERCAIWRARVATGSNLRVGLAWAGNPDNPYDRRRSIPPEKFLPLFDVPGVVYYSLQCGLRTSIPRALENCGLTHLASSITDFADSAAVMAELDLIITVDTATAHLAGALGRPVWTLLPFVPDWRWGLKDEDTPWYPTMRLFRQHAVGDWNSVLQRVANALRQQAVS